MKKLLNHLIVVCMMLTLTVNAAAVNIQPSADVENVGNSQVGITQGDSIPERISLGHAPVEEFQPKTEEFSAQYNYINRIYWNGMIVHPIAYSIADQKSYIIEDLWFVENGTTYNGSLDLSISTSKMREMEQILQYNGLIFNGWYTYVQLQTKELYNATRVTFTEHTSFGTDSATYTLKEYNTQPYDFITGLTANNTYNLEADVRLSNGNILNYGADVSYYTSRNNYDSCSF